MSATTIIPEIPPLSAAELYGSLGLLRIMEPQTELFMQRRNDREWRAADQIRGHWWHTSFHACLAGETEVVTRTGIKPIRELLGIQELLIPSATKHNGLDREGRGQRLRKYNSGRFQEVQVSSYGHQDLYEVKLRRGRQRKTVRVTAPHRWMLKTTEMVDTLQLRSGDRLKGIRARRVGSIKMVPFAVAQGFVFGDGTARRGCRDAAWLDLHHNGKDEAMLAFFRGHKMRSLQREGRMDVTQIQGLPRLWKQTPSFEESTPFLLSWLAGYFAADGSVSKKGQATLVSVSREAIDFARGVMSICGVSYGGVTVDVQSGTYPHGATYEDKIMYSVSLNVRDLPAWFFVLPKHAQRVQERIAKEPGERQEWQVVSVSPLGISEEVFCATVPDVGCFALSDELLTGNSEFPGDDPDGCERYLVYRMMDIPGPEPMPPWVTTTGSVGKAGELDIVNAWYEEGHALAIPEDRPEGQHQLVFEHRDVWMSASTDLPVLFPGHRRPHIVEIKGKADEVLEEMLRGRWDDRLQRFVQRKYDPAHRKQLLASLGLGHEFDWGEVTVCEHCWGIIYGDVFVDPENSHWGRMNPAISAERAAEDNLRHCPFCRQEYEGETFHLDPPETGSIYYWSRSWPRKTIEFFFHHDREFMRKGFEVLKTAREHFVNNTIPPRREGFAWSLGACKLCPMKKHACKPDFGPKKSDQPVTVLSETNGIAHARTVYEDGYDPEAVLARVLERWNG